MPEDYKYSYIDIPRNDILIFGDGLFGGVLLHTSQKYISREGIEMQQLVFIPSKELIQAYQIPRSDRMPFKGEIIREYPVNRVWLSGHDPMLGRRTFVLCDYRGHETVLTRLNAEFLVRNDMLQRECTALKSGLKKQQHENRDMMAYTEEWWDKYIAIISKGKPLMGPTIITGVKRGMQQQEELIPPEFSEP